MTTPKLFAFISVIAFSVLMEDSVAEVFDAHGGQFTVNGSDISGGINPWNKPGMNWDDVGRLDIGWGGDGGGNLETYAKYSERYPDRSGNFHFVYGGKPSIGKIIFVNYDGTNWFTRMILTNDGRLGIGLGPNEPCGDCKLDVNGKIRANEIVVDSMWADYVFSDSHDLMPLPEVDRFIKSNGHLPGLPKADDVSANGIGLAKFSQIMLEKIEELTLYVIDLERRNQELAEQIVRIANVSE